MQLTKKSIICTMIEYQKCGGIKTELNVVLSESL
jgi:hypothetical protein